MKSLHKLKTKKTNRKSEYKQDLPKPFQGIFIILITHYRTLTIHNVFFEQNKMAKGGIRNTATGDSIDVSCFYSHIGPSWIQFSSVIVQTLFMHASFV